MPLNIKFLLLVVFTNLLVLVDQLLLFYWGIVALAMWRFTIRNSFQVFNKIR